MFSTLTKKLSTIFQSISGSGYLTKETVAQTVDQIKEALLEADVPFEVVQKFCTELQQETEGSKVLKGLKPGEQVIKIVHDKLISYLGGIKNSSDITKSNILLVMGLQGSGKTTSIAKLANYLQEQKKVNAQNILVSSLDFNRPAAQEQLAILAKQVGASCFKPASTDPVQAAQEIKNEFRRRNYKYLIVDTAGRMHVDNQLLEELRSIDSIINPSSKLLVVDAMTGQQSLSVARAFDQAVGFNSVIMTKMDSDASGGAAFGFRYMLAKPISFVGTGEKCADLQLFRPDRIAKRLLGMGDMVTLAEEAQKKIKKAEQESSYNALKRGRLTLTDFAKQMEMMSKLGSLSHIMKYLPGMGAQLSDAQIEAGESQMKKFKALISSMTPKERACTELIKGSRKVRIAQGAGMEVKDVNFLLERFDQCKQYVKLLKMSRLTNLFK